MKKSTINNGLLLFMLLLFVVSLVSCTGDDYLNAVPGNSIAVVSVDAARSAGDGKADAARAGLLKSLLRVDDFRDCGIGLTSKLYLFESAEGNLGLVAKVSDDDDLDTWLNKLAGSGLCTKTSKRSGCRFSTIKDSWVVGFNSSVMVIMGPVIAAQEAAVRQQIIKYIGQDEDEGLKSSPLFDRLDSIDAPVAIVAQVAALPDNFSAPFTLGAPKDADASQVLLAAGMRVGKGGFLEITGQPFSLNRGIDEAMKKSLSTLRPITSKYVGSMSRNDALGAFMNVNGQQFIGLLHANKSFMALLAGINTAVDMDNIIRSIDGDMAIVLPEYSNGAASMRLSAGLGSRAFLADVDYWKKSCPKGGRIEDLGKDLYCYTDGSMSYVFGVTADGQFYSGSTKEQALQSIGTAPQSLPRELQSAIKGKRLAMVLNIAALLGGNDGTAALLPVLKPLLGDVNTVVYSVK